MRLTISAALLIGCSGTVLSGCGGDVPRSDVSAGQWSVGEAWRVQEEWRIGGAEAGENEAFSGMRMDVALGPNEQVFVLDPQPREIRVFDRQGTYVRTIGRRGEGPGELSSPASIAWAPDDRLWVRDQRGRYVVFDSVGTLVTTYERPQASVPSPSGAGVFDSSGRFLDEGHWWFDDGRTGVVLFRVSPDGELLDTLSVVEHPAFLRRAVPTPTTGVAVERPVSSSLAQFFELYRPRLEFALASDSTIWMAESNVYRLVQRSFRGDTIDIIDGPDRSYTLDSDELRRIDEVLAADGFERDMYAFGRQTVQGLRVLPDGHLLVGIERVPGAPTSLLDVFTPEGSYLGGLELPFAVRLGELDIRGDTIVALTRDELHAPLLIRAILERNSD